MAFPSPFKHLLRLMSVFSFDSLSSACIFKGSNYFASVYIYSCFPLMIAAIIVTRYIAKKAVSVYHRQHSDADLLNLKRDWIQCTHSLLLLTFLVLPVVSLKQFQGLACTKVGGSYYLQVDTSIDCASERYASFAVVDTILVVCYMMIPVVWLCLLYYWRPLLNPPTSDLRLARYLRSQNEELKPLKFLFEHYHPRFYYFEVVET